MQNLPIGQSIEAIVTAPDSFYKRVIGDITTLHNDGRVGIKAKMVISKWSNSWKAHPTCCAMNVDVKNIVR